MTVSALIADDEPIARRGLRDLLGAVDWITVIGEASNGPAAVAAIDRLRPDLVFLDVRMPGMLGTDVFAATTHRPRVIFTTAYAQHAVTAFELGALDYLLKPFGADRLHTSLERLRAAVVGRPESPSDLDRLRETAGPQPLSRLFARGPTGLVPISTTEVIWFEARGDYVAAHLAGARHLLHVSLAHLETRLDPRRFHRIHRTHIVNLDRVVSFRRAGKDRWVALLEHGTELPVSRLRVQELKHLAR